MVLSFTMLGEQVTDASEASLGFFLFVDRIILLSYSSCQDLTALAKELRAVDDVRPPHKVTDYSSSSEDSGTTDEEDDEEVDQEAGDESTSGAEDSRAGYVQ